MPQFDGFSPLAGNLFIETYLPEALEIYQVGFSPLAGNLFIETRVACCPYSGIRVGFSPLAGNLFIETQKQQRLSCLELQVSVPLRGICLLKRTLHNGLQSNRLVSIPLRGICLLKLKINGPASLPVAMFQSPCGEFVY